MHCGAAVEEDRLTGFEPLHAGPRYELFSFPRGPLRVALPLRHVAPLTTLFLLEADRRGRS
jgi:hypothetical protein